LDFDDSRIAARAEGARGTLNQVFDLPPGHVTWVEGDDELVMVDWAGGAGLDARPGEESRSLATILCTDIVDSTGLARDAGDASWKRTLSMAGLAVHTAARVVAEAGAGEVLVSGTTRDLAEGATGLTFELRGRHRLKGLAREHELFAAGSAAG
jgi:class 3 adenylate cyclase